MNSRNVVTAYIGTEEQEALAKRLTLECALSPLVSRILVGRGVCTPDAVRRFLAPSLEQDWLDPEIIPGLVAVADKIESVIRNGGRILVFGDFDVDGITATAVSVRGLRALGADVVGLIPHRYEEGYALSEAAVMRGMEHHPDLIVTVDCGISCGAEVEWMLAQGIDVAITDHHEPGENVPQGVPVADPKIDANNPSKDLAGVGVALKLLCLLGKRFGKPDLWREFTDFAALGTVADLMTLRGENRALVADGISRINNRPRICINALAGICGIEPDEITSTKLSFSLIPRINASGRMGDATVALDLLLSDELEEAQRLAAALDQVNKERREAEAFLTSQVEEYLDEHFHGEEAIVAAGEGWHEGVKGIVASRIARKYERPAIIFGIEDGVARGSGRTFGNINLFEQVSTCSDLFDKFGGHAAAMGITLPVENLEPFSKRLCESLQKIDPSTLKEVSEADTTVALDECTVENFEELEKLQPFGSGNPVPRLVACNVFLDDRGAVGKGSKHMRFYASDGVSKASAIWFNPPRIEEVLACESLCDVVFEPSVDEWNRRKTAKLMVKEVLDQQVGIAEDELDPVADLLARSVEICDRGDYAGIAQAESFHTKIVGVTFENRQEALAGLEAGTELVLERQPSNEFDGNAIAVRLYDGTQLGYLNRQLAARLAPVMDGGEPYDAAVTEVTGGSRTTSAQDDVRAPGPLGVRDPGIVDRSFGVNIIVRKVNASSEELSAEDLRLNLFQAKQKWREVEPSHLDDELRRALIGDHQLHRAQRETLGHLAQGHSTLAVMATGRGKSLIFHMHAARTALLQNKASVFVYPLRALVADQAYHLQETYGIFGLQVCILTGETDPTEREDIYERLSRGEIDVILTTPEFLSIHAGRFMETQRVGFVVVDEAHHIGQSRAGNRPAYADLNRALDTLGNPLVLAVTATAGDEEAKAICRTLSIEKVVLDPTVRENLHIDDKRDLRNRENYLASLVATGSKVVAYVNSREQTIELTRMLRHKLPAFAPRIAFYNAGLPKADRKRIESAFRTGDLMAIVSTSAFGEGIDIPDVEHVVLYHLPFNSVEFNQMSGRAGRDGREAHIHLLYGYGDARINENILSSSAPSREQMVALYRVLKARGKKAAEQGEEAFKCTNSELSEECTKLDKRNRVDESAVSTGISVFRELGFLETSGKSVARHIRMIEGPQKMSLESSVRYKEGSEEIQGFAVFKQWALGAGEDDLLKRFNRPILPNNPELLL